MKQRHRALLFFIGCAALAGAFVLPAMAAGDRELTGWDFVKATVGLTLGAQPLHALKLSSAVAANLILPLCAAFALARRGRRIALWVCTFTLVPAILLLIDALGRPQVTLHVGVLIWFCAMALFSVIVMVPESRT